MKKSLLTVAVSILLAAAVLVGAPAALAAADPDPAPSPEPAGSAAPVENLVLSKTNILNLRLPSAFLADNWVQPADDNEHKTGVQVDLYKVADAVKVPGVDAYTFKDFHEEENQAGDLTDLYKEMSGKKAELTAADWEAMAQLAAGMLFTGFDENVCSEMSKWGSVGTVKLDGKGTASIEDLDPGLYLIVAHEPGVTAGYARNIAGDGQTPQIVTMAYSAYNEYMFKPALVSLPARGQPDYTPDQALPGGNTAYENGAWQYDVQALLKGDHQPRYGQLQINKTVNGFVGTEPATFVFRIYIQEPTQIGAAVGDLPAVPGEEPEVDVEKLPYRDVAITVGPDTRHGEVTVGHIPVGSVVTIEEVDTGDSYTTTIDGEDHGTIQVTEIIKFDVTNTGDNENKNGSGVVNQFDANANGGWTWHKNGEDMSQASGEAD